MFESIINFFKKFGKTDNNETKSKDTAKERLHLVLMQDRANVSADFLEMMKQEIIEVIKKYIEVDEKEIDVRLTNEVKVDGTTGAPSLYANIPIVNIKNEMKKEIADKAKNDDNKETNIENKEVANNNEKEDKKEAPEEPKEKEQNQEEKEKQEEQEEVKEEKGDSKQESSNNKEEVQEEVKQEAQKENNKKEKSGK